jgi:glycosyltransferase involved in cell wall biosynthesis
MNSTNIDFKRSIVIFEKSLRFQNWDKTSFNSLPKVSFVIPTLNSERTLEKCLKSITSQDYQRIEIIVVDGGSTDNTIKIAKKYEAKIYHFEGPLGDARNLGIKKSSGELIALWDSDVYIPHRKWLLKGVKKLSEYPNASTLWVLTAAPPHATMLTKAYNWFSWAVMLFLAKMGIGFWGGGISIFRKEAIEEVGGITTGIDTGEDYDLARKLAMKKYHVVFFNEPVYHDTHSSLAEIVRKDLRRSKNFKMYNLSDLSGVPLCIFLMVSLIVGLYLSIKYLFKRKKVFYGIIPILLIIRLITYAVSYLLR